MWQLGMSMPQAVKKLPRSFDFLQTCSQPMADQRPRNRQLTQTLYFILYSSGKLEEKTCSDT